MSDLLDWLYDLGEWLADCVVAIAFHGIVAIRVLIEWRRVANA